jgi:polysaccharide deacetylase family protein (PEP-CTERM system associated)
MSKALSTRSIRSQSETWNSPENCAEFENTNMTASRPDHVRVNVNAFTVDVEDYFHVEAFANAISRESWPKLEYRCERNVHRILDMLAERNVRGTFFVLGWVAERSPELVKAIAAAGHEVACHGFSHQLVYRQTREQFTSETRRAKELLEDLVGKPVLGYRAASFSITKVSMWALDVLIDLGFTYDSSVFPVKHHDNYGIPEAPLGPFRLRAPSGRTLIEVPLSVASFLGARVPVSGGGYFRLFPYWLSRAGMRQIEQAGERPVVFYFHPWEIDVDQPRVAANLVSRMRHYNNIGKCEPRLRRLLADFNFGTMSDALAARGMLPIPHRSREPVVGLPAIALT